MGDRESPPCEADWEAARAAMRDAPHLATKKWPRPVEEFLAQLHQIYGPDRFRLRIGLREPRNVIEQWDLELFRGQITPADFREKLRAHVTRPVDAEMLRAFFDSMREDLECYSRFIRGVSDLLFNPRRKVVSDADEAEIDQLAHAFPKKLGLFKQELESVFDFLSEARIEKRMGHVRHGKFSAPTASELVVSVIDNTQKLWKSSYEIGLKSRTQMEYTHSEWGIHLFGQTSYPSLPVPQDLLTLIEEECTLAKIFLRESLASRPVNLAAADETEAPAGNHLLTVRHWVDLAIGIDEHFRYWAKTPAPAVGGSFKKSDAIELPLRGAKWKAVLGAFATSSDPNRITRHDLLRALDRLPPPAQQNAAQRAYADELLAVSGDKSFAAALRDLSRKLRDFVDGPTGRGQSVFAVEGDAAVCRCYVRFLVSDESGHLQFGVPPRS